MSINDYLIEQKDIDWPSLMQLFKWLLPERFTLWLLVTKFADLIFVFEDGSVHLFRADSGHLEKLADSRDSFMNWSTSKKMDSTGPGQK